MVGQVVISCLRDPGDFIKDEQDLDEREEVKKDSVLLGFAHQFCVTKTGSASHKDPTSGIVWGKVHLE